MSDYQQGRTNAVFSVGSKVEDLSEMYEKETCNLEAMKVALGMAGKTLETYCLTMQKELEQAKIPLKEAEFGKVYVCRCIELIRKLYNDTEAKRLQAKGASEAMKHTVESLKGMYDEERMKLATHEEYEKDPDKDIKDRPVGVDPGNPLGDYKKSVDDDNVAVVSTTVSSKKQRRMKSMK